MTGNQPRPVSVWLTHHRMAFSIAYTAILCGQLIWPRNPHLLCIYAPALLAVWAAVVGELRHDTILCRRCAAAFPVDGAARAARATRRLRYTHHRMKVLIGVFLPAVVAVTWWEWLLVPIWIGLCVDLAVARTHQRLTLWCPWCRDPGSDTGCDAPVPTLRSSR